MCINRWPVIYDFDDLLKEIEKLKKDEIEFYQSKEKELAYLCQGDIFELATSFPYIDENGDISIEDTGTWVLIGNTCDMQRNVSDLKYTQIAPLYELTDEEIAPVLNDLKAYQSFKKFYFKKFENKHYILDFTRICTIDKSFLKINAKKIKELSMPGWVLFHCCIVRYLARDDGRND